jgi:hypothetical protein
VVCAHGLVALIAQFGALLKPAERDHLHMEIP